MPSFVNAGSPLLSAKRVAANGGRLAYSTRTTTNTVSNTVTRHMATLGATWTDIQVMVSNFYANFNNGQATDVSDMTNVKASIQVGATIYPCAAPISIAHGSSGLITIPNVSLTPGQIFYVLLHVEYASGSKKVPINTLVTGMPVWDTGYLQGTDASVDITVTGIPTGATATCTVAGGSITALNLTAGGSGFTAGSADVYAYEEQANGVLAQKLIGSATIAGGTVTGLSLTSGTVPTGVTSWVSPTITISHGGLITLASHGVQGLGPSLIVGKPSNPVRSVLGVGDSIMYGFSDGLIGDVNSNNGSFEVGMTNRFGFANAAVPGLNVFNLFETTKSYSLILNVYLPYITDVICQLGVNDPAWNRSRAQIQADLLSIKAYYNTRGRPVSFCTITPRTNSTDGWITTGNQSEFTWTGGIFGATTYHNDSDFRTQHNADLRAGTLAGDNPYIDFSALVESSGSPTKWDVTNFTTNDGLHSVDTVGSTNRNGVGRSKTNTAFKAAFNFLAIIQ